MINLWKRILWKYEGCDILICGTTVLQGGVDLSFLMDGGDAYEKSFRF